MNLLELLDEAVRSSPEKTFLLHGEQRLTYLEFAEQVRRAASAMSRGGIVAGDRLALSLPNRPELLVLWFAAASLGAIEVPLNPSLRARELRHVLRDSGAKWIWVERSSMSALTEVRSDCPELARVVTLAGDDETGARDPDSWNVLLAEADGRPVEATTAPEPEDPLAILYTSGTTGSPKGAVLSHRSAVLTGQSTAHMLGATASDRIATPNPLFHVNAQFHGAVTAVACRGSFVLLPRFRRSQILEQIAHYRATILLLAAAATTMTYSREPSELDGRTGLRTLLTGGVPADLYDSFERRFGLRIQTAYAMTEAPVAIMAPTAESERRPTPGIGIPMSHPDPSFENEVDVVDDDGEPLPPGRHGELRVRNAALTSGYWNDATHPRARSRDGYWLTGDLGYIDEDGYFYFVGRTKDVIRHRGEMVAPGEIESVLSRHPSVAECAVVGVPSKLGVADEDVVAYVVARAEERIRSEELEEWCRARLAPFKVPRDFVARDALPKTPLGKIQKSKLSSSTTASSGAGE